MDMRENYLGCRETVRKYWAEGEGLAETVLRLTYEKCKGGYDENIR